MAISTYDKELAKLPETYAAAIAADVTQLKYALASASESSLIGVGSGGSFTVASLLCNLHEAYTGRVSRPSTPLELICNPTLASSSPVFLISAEGKNPDILEALARARLHSARIVHVLTNRGASPLMESVANLTDVRAHVFELVEKDGYLATNSLLLDAVLIAKAYGELNQAGPVLPPIFDEMRIAENPIATWLSGADEFVVEVVKRGALTIIYSPLLRSIAADLESKLSEAALLHIQLADLRSYAHGRHLWLENRPQDCTILALTEPSLFGLWDSMRALFPTTVPVLTMPLSGAAPRDLVAGLVAEMGFVSAIAGHLGQDPGRPVVPSFGRELHYADLHDAIPLPVQPLGSDEQSKYDVLGARWPSPRNYGSMRRAAQSFRTDIERQRFRSVVFDYDGTLCSFQSKDSLPHSDVLRHIERLVRANVVVGIASGRGGSVQTTLKNAFAPDILGKIQLCLYNGGWIANATTEPTLPGETSEYLSHVTRIIVRLKAAGVPIQEHKTTHPWQVSVRFSEGLSTDMMWFVIGDALRQAGLDLSRMVRSKHSIDILGTGITKSRLVAHIIQSSKIDPYEILTIGDQGAWPGNDYALLEHRFSLSVDLPSRRSDRGWKLAPSRIRNVDAAMWYMKCMNEVSDGTFSMTFPTLGREPAH